MEGGSDKLIMDLTDKLRKVNSTSTSIQSVSGWCLFHRRECKRIVGAWFNEFMKADKKRQLALLYLANDIMQNSIRQYGPDYMHEFYVYMAKALNKLTSDGDAKLLASVTRVCQVWHDRQVFGREGVSRLIHGTKIRLDAPKTAAPAACSPPKQAATWSPVASPRSASRPESKDLRAVSDLVERVEREEAAIRKLESQYSETLSVKELDGTFGQFEFGVADKYEANLRALLDAQRKLVQRIDRWRSALGVQISNRDETHEKMLEKIANAKRWASASKRTDAPLALPAGGEGGATPAVKRDDDAVANVAQTLQAADEDTIKKVSDDFLKALQAQAAQEGMQALPAGGEGHVPGAKRQRVTE